MKVKYFDNEFTIKDLDSARFRRDSQIIVAEYYSLLSKFRPVNITNGKAEINDSLDLGMMYKVKTEFFYPEVKGEVMPRFKEFFEMFLDGDLSVISYDMKAENATELERLGSDVLNFFLNSGKQPEPVANTTESTSPAG